MKTYKLLAIGFFLSLESGFSEERHSTPSIASVYEVTIRNGETLSAVALRHRTSVARLVESNGLASANQIVAGQTLKIARKGAGASWAGGRIQILRGDTLNLIALVLGVDPGVLAKRNGISRHDSLIAGEWLEIPRSTTKHQISGATPIVPPSEVIPVAPSAYAYPGTVSGTRTGKAAEERIAAPVVPEVQTEEKDRVASVKILESISPQEAADQFGLSLDTLVELNPELRGREVIEKGTVVLLPKVFLGID